MGKVAIVLLGLFGWYGLQNAYDAKDFYSRLTTSEQESCKELYGGYLGCVNTLSEVVAKAREDMQHCEQMEDWSDCMPNSKNDD